jgi:hypothetical protein
MAQGCVDLPILFKEWPFLTIRAAEQMERTDHLALATSARPRDLHFFHALLSNTVLRTASSRQKVAMIAFLAARSSPAANYVRIAGLHSNDCATSDIAF